MTASPLTDTSRLAVHTITTKPWSIQEICDKYPAAGVAGVSVWRNVFDDTPASKVGDMLKGASLEPAALVRGGFFPGNTAEERQKALDDNKQAIDEAAAVGAPMVVLVCGAVPGMPINTAIDQIREGMEAVLPHAKANNVCLAIEPLHPMYADCRSAVSTMKSANDLAEYFNDDCVGIAVDVFHVWWDPDCEKEIKRCGANGNLAGFHICDWKMDMADMLNDRGLMGEGVINIAEIRGWVEEAGFTGFNEVEVFSHHWWNQDQDAYLAEIKSTYFLKS